MKIAKKISLSFFATGMILTTIGVSTIYVVTKGVLFKETGMFLEAVAHSRKAHIETYLNMLKVSVAQLSKSVALENVLKTPKDSPEWSKAFEQAQTRLKRTREANPSLYMLMLLDPAGRVIAASDDVSIGLDRSQDKFFTQGKKGIYIKDAYFPETVKKPMMAVSAPVPDADTGRLLGVLVARAELNDLYKIVTEGTGLGKTGEVYIVNEDGYMITPSRFLKDTFLEKKINTEDFSARVFGPERQKPAMPIAVFENYMGQKVVGEYEFLPELKWYLLTEINAREAFAHLNWIRFVLLIILILIPIAAWLAGILLAGAITKPLHQLHKGMEVVGSGNLDYKVGTTAKDEIGQLSRAFDTMTEDLKKKIISVDTLNKEIAEHKETEEALWRAEQKTRALLDQTFQFIGMMKLDGTLIEANKAALELSGISVSEVIGKPFWETPWWTHSPELQEKLRQSIKRAAHGEFIRFEATHIDKAGKTHYVDFSLKPVQDKVGKIIFLIPEGRDITEQKEAQAKVAEAMQIKSEFISMVSHELRTPMTAIQEGIGIVLDGSAGEVNDDQKEFLGLAKRNVDRLSRLINDVLDYQKLEAGRMVFYMRETDPNALIDEVIKVMLPVAKNKNLYLDRLAPEGLPKIIIDKDKITQVLINLVNNAIKFTEQGGVTITASKEDDSILFSVKDTGPGMAGEDLPKLFQGFSQLEAGALRKTGGTGLGLAISRKIILEHRGEIWAESEFGRGSDFKFRLPAKAKYKVLIVDDEKYNLDICKNFLGEDKYSTVCLDKGLDAIESINKDKPDLIILDMRLKDINGYEIIGRLRSNKETAIIPILAMSAYPEEMLKIEDKRDDSALASIAKPFHLEDLLLKVRLLLKQEA